jgi:hypothetical protein
VERSLKAYFADNAALIGNRLTTYQPRQFAQFKTLLTKHGTVAVIAAKSIIE